MKLSNDPFWWSFFGAGGLLTAFLTPILLLLTGLATPLGWLPEPSHATLLQIFCHPLVRAFLFVFVALSLVHWAHRFRFALYDGLQLKHLFGLIATLCYGGAIVITAAAGYILW